MPVAKLFVEGNLDSELLASVLAGTPLVLMAGSKYALGTRSRMERTANSVTGAYLRDRDFDYAPPADRTRPTVDRLHEGTPLGWRWCRLEIENYLIDPHVMNVVTSVPVTDIEAAIRDAAVKIRHYQAARWTIGVVRRHLPPQHQLATRPRDLNEIALPPTLDHDPVRAWTLGSIDEHRKPITAATDPTAVATSFEAFDSQFGEVFLANVQEVLYWFSGKDLLAALTQWIVRHGFSNPGTLRAGLREWVRANPAAALDFLPEWKAMVNVLRA